jgi:uncharacterized spore protein YtfJ
MGRIDRKGATMAVSQEASALADDLLRRIGDTVGDKAKAATVFGEPVEREGITVIPVAKARFGFGGGGGSGGPEGREGSGGGGGGGAMVSPVGYIELRDGTARYKRIATPSDLLPVVVAASIAMLAVKQLLGARPSPKGRSFLPRVH